MRLRRLILVLCCMLLLSLCANAAAARAETMKVAMTVDENGTTKAEVSLHLVCDGSVPRLSIALGPNVSGVRLDGHSSEVTRSGGQTTVVLTDETGLPAEMDLHLSYTVRNTVDPDSESQRFSLRLLGGLQDADIEKFTANIQMPGGFDAIPEFSSGYYAEGIDNYLTIHVSADGLITATSMDSMLAGETLDLRLETGPDYFSVHNVAGRTLLVDRIAMIVLALFGALYWWRALRSPLPRVEPQTRAPMGVEPGVAGLLTVGAGPDLALMALNWAACGYLRATRVRGGRLLLTQLIPMGNERSSYEQAVFQRLFAHTGEVLSGSNSWTAAQNKADKAARSYWNGRLYEKRRGRPGILRACAVLLCGFAALSGADRVIPSMTLRPLLLAAAALAGVIWGMALQYALRRVLLHNRQKPIILLLLCLAVLIAAIRLTGERGALLCALLFSAAVWLALIFGPKRRRTGVDTLSDLLGWRRYLRTLTPTLAQQLLAADSQYYYRTLLFAEALGVGGSFSRAFDGQKMVVCNFFERDGKPAPRSAGKYRELLLDTLAAARGEARGKSAGKKTSGRSRTDRRERPRRPAGTDEEVPAQTPEAEERVRNNNPRRRTVEVYDPESEY